MRIETYRCDVCGVEKREANHWWWLGWNESYQRAVLLTAAVRAQRFSEDENVKYVKFDLCGEACVTKKLSEFMERTVRVYAQTTPQARAAKPEPQL